MLNEAGRRTRNGFAYFTAKFFVGDPYQNSAPALLKKSRSIRSARLLMNDLSTIDQDWDARNGREKIPVRFSDPEAVS